MVAFWHPFKNGGLRPQDLAFKTSVLLWWKCPTGRDHEWQARPRNYRDPMTCPFCGNRRASEDNNVAVRFPKVARTWHPTLNGATTPRDVAAGHTKLVWWRCKRGHVWRQSVVRRVASAVACRACYREDVRAAQAANTGRLRLRCRATTDAFHS